ncbi:CPBP family intramembrane glutamic endopeptidase [Gillisia limnaea]|uniref:Abortive infection protein n=1 Tax=Gillisia limnaea (strain DSM 15749 / LMG 21470 / R-8282) TaxID=865937 RepID=H2BTN5_GILLR|nr:CPBP family intramembrane glutamic endopeptidase [Gillisia limnaea]EHQ02655.1 Abortive infection protein [Gillisia limnaea DSM 15749]
MEFRFYGWARVLLLIIPYLIIVGLFQFGGMILAGVNYDYDSQIEETSLQRLVVQFSNLFGNFLVLWIFMKYVDKEKFIELGFHIRSKLNHFIVGLILGALIMCVGYLLLVSIEEITFQSISFNFIEILISLGIFTIVAFVEETLFRGYVLRNFMRSFNKYLALLVSSFLFAALHGFNPNFDMLSFLSLFLAGMALGISYIYTKNLWFPIGLHLSWNFFQSIFGFNVSGQNFYSLFQTQITSETLLNGGEFGFENSILGIIAEIAIVLMIFLYFTFWKPGKTIPV